MNVGGGGFLRRSGDGRRSGKVHRRVADGPGTAIRTIRDLRLSLRRLAYKVSNFIFVEDSPTIDRSTYLRIAKTICRGERICIVMFWNDRTKVPRSLPMTDAQINAKVAHYNLNKNTGLDRVLICAVDGC